VTGDSHVIPVYPSSQTQRGKLQRPCPWQWRGQAWPM